MRGHYVRSESSKVLSYHRLRDATVAERIVASTGLAPPSLVFELGAGEGDLTDAIRRRARKVVAIELDRQRWSALRARFRDDPRVEPVLSDFLAFRYPDHADYTMVSNVPFGVTAALMRRIQSLANPPRDAYLILQAEAAAKWSGLGGESVASLTLKIRFECDVILALRRGDFVPRPAVDCVLLHLHRRPRPLFTGAEWRAFEAFARRAFESGTARHRPAEVPFSEWVARFRASSGPGKRTTHLPPMARRR